MPRGGPSDARLIVPRAPTFHNAPSRVKIARSPLENVARHIENPVRAGTLCVSANWGSSFVMVGVI